MSVNLQQIGSFVDSVAGTWRSQKAVAKRLIEEVAELGLAAGLTAGEIVESVMDATHNEALKASRAAGKTVFPSQVRGVCHDLPGECGDVSLCLKDLCYIAGIVLAAEEERKFAKLKAAKRFNVTPSGVIYAVKDHVTVPETEKSA